MTLYLPTPDTDTEEDIPQCAFSFQLEVFEHGAATTFNLNTGTFYSLNVKQHADVKFVAVVYWTFVRTLAVFCYLLNA